MWGQLTLLRQLVAQFFRWWGGELLGLIPQQLRDRLKPRGRLTVVDVDAEGTVLAVMRPGRKVAEPLAKALPPGSRCRLRLPPAAVVGKTLVLPEAAAATLAAVLRFQIEQETPFRAGDVYADHAVVRRDARAKRIVVDWRLAPRALVDRAVAAAESLGLRVQSIGIADDAAGAWRFDFLRAQRDTGATASGGQRLLRQALVGLLALLTAALVAVPLVRKLEASDALESRVAEAAEAATAARSLAEELERLRARSGFVVGRRLERPTVSELLRELTILLPDDTWLHRLTVEGDEVSIAGLSPSSTALVARIDAHPWFQQVSYGAPTLQRRGSKLEAFDLTLRLSAEARPQ